VQTYALTIDKFLDHAAKWFPQREVVTAELDGRSSRSTYACVRDRGRRLSGALTTLGLGFGDRIGTLAWNTQHHLEMYYAAMGSGLVCHTLNPRLTAEHLAGMVNEAEDRVLAVSANLAALTTQLLPLCPLLQHVIVMDDSPDVAFPGGRAKVWAYEDLLETHGFAMDWGGFPEETPAGLCYTSGTTGRPKGVLYTHRSNYLHTLRALQADAFAFQARDVVLAAVPMFHANGWGIPFAAPAVGATLVLPGRHTDGASLARLMRAEKVTVAVGVQTVWLGLVDHLQASGETLPDLERVTIGGSSCPEALIARLETGLGAAVQTSWGMTELSPLGTVSPAFSGIAGPGAGRPAMGVDLLLTDRDGTALPEQRGVVGHLKVKGPSVIDRYFKADDEALDANGWFDTGDLATIDPAGNLTICGRSKDLIKSGGEWINPADIEAIIGRDPAVAQVAVIARSHPKWGERPVLIVEPQQGQSVDAAILINRLRGQVAAWWLPDEVIQLNAMPLAATGKIDKMRLRSDFGGASLFGDAPEAETP
jgi:acyl-CoA synthetase (AMP-forming)/AMP-acid ligase II